MATVTLNATQFQSWYINAAEWRDNSSNGGVWVWSRVSSNPSNGYRVGRVIFAGAGIGAATVNSATLRVKVKTPYYSGYPAVNTAFRLRIALATSTGLYTTDITANYLTTALATYSADVVYSFPVTSLLGNIASINSEFCAYLVIDSPDNADVTFYNLADYQTSLVVDYTPALSDTVGRYNGTAFENCEVQWFNGTAWELCNVFRYDSTQFVEQSTT